VQSARQQHGEAIRCKPEERMCVHDDNLSQG
jgi:hypothetical protein